MSFVCIVDDDASVRSGPGNLLKAVGYTAVTFASEKEFLASPVVDDETVRRAMLHGAVGFLHKPFVEDVLLDSILLATGRKGEVN
ncbi:hypothetical protein [Paraburkholderia phenazinium]|jgi:FixJ family two-component response regulator|uniref:hypothetical protein n=1 Tax=Paraburkholderia phenazinium TaxID=60549 RepID=UPI000B886D32|nr:hypothetical protein [Paraburkholderia phenazinium]